MRILILAALAATTLAALPGAASAADATVAVGNDRTFSPTSVTIAPTDSVTWNWVGPDTDHSIVSNAGQAESFDSDPVAQNDTRGVGGTFEHTFQRSGSFTYVCRIHPDRMRGTVTVTGAPTARLTATPANPFTDASVALDASTSTDPDGTIAKYEWDLDGNGSFESDTGTTATNSASFATPGARTVRVRITDDRDNTSQAQQTVTVRSRAPVPSFTTTPATAAKGQVVEFDASATTDPDAGGITKHEWDLDGNGTFETDTATTATTSRSYAAAGAVVVTLRVTDAGGLTATTTRTVTVTNQAPAAAITASDPAPLSGVSVTFDASGSTDGDGTVASYRWDLDGDGTFETAASASSTIAHTFARGGSKTVRVQVTDDEGATATALVAVLVGNRGPTAAFTMPSSAVAGSPVLLDGSGSTDPEATALAYAWDLDNDGTYETSSGASPTLNRSFGSAGTITVGLRVTDADGGTHTTTRTITVTPAPPPPVVDAAPAASSPGPAASPAGPAPAPAPAPSAVPSRRVTLVASAARGQRLGRKGAVAVSVRCDGACAVQARGTLKVRGKTFRLRGASRSLAGPGSAKLTLRVAAGDLRALRRALGRRGRATASLSVGIPGGAPAQRVRVALKA